MYESVFNLTYYSFSFLTTKNVNIGIGVAMDTAIGIISVRSAVGASSANVTRNNVIAVF